MNNKIPCGGFYLSDTLGVDENGKLGVNGGEPYKSLVTDGEGGVQWEDRLVYDDSKLAIDAGQGVQYVKEIDLALTELKNGNRVKRKGWNGDGIFLVLQVPDKNSKMTQPYIYIDTLGLKTNNPNAPKGRVPWLASQTDMLAEDWEVINA